MPIEQKTHHLHTASSKTPLIICPGFHPRSWTDAFLQNMSFVDAHPICLFPTEKYPACSGIHLFEFMRSCVGCNSKTPWTPCESVPILISFSAGVVGAMQAAWAWQRLGGQIAAILAIDGWGVPLVSSIPCYRLSHDLFTHWSSALLGAGHDSFYASPAISHADLWKMPQQVEGFWMGQENGCETRRPLNAAAFMQQIVHRHGAFSR